MGAFNARVAAFSVDCPAPESRGRMQASLEALDHGVRCHLLDFVNSHDLGRVSATSSEWRARVEFSARESPTPRPPLPHCYGVMTEIGHRLACHDILTTNRARGVRSHLCVSQHTKEHTSGWSAPTRRDWASTRRLRGDTCFRSTPNVLFGFVRTATCVLFASGALCQQTLEGAG